MLAGETAFEVGAAVWKVFLPLLDSEEALVDLSLVFPGIAAIGEAVDGEVALRHELDESSGAGLCDRADDDAEDDLGQEW